MTLLNTLIKLLLLPFVFFWRICFDQYGATGFGIIVVCLLVLTIIIGGLGTLIYYGNKAACRSHAEELGVQYKHKLFGNCYLKQDGRFVPSSKYELKRI